MAGFRRFMSCAGRRRDVISPATGPTYQSILGANLTTQWHSLQGIVIGDPGGANEGVDTWTDSIGGRVVQAPAATQRPTYGADGVAFGGKSVVKADRATQKFLSATGLAVMAATGTKPWIFMRARYRAVGAAEGNSAACGGNGDLWVYILNAAGTNFRKIGPSATTIDRPGADTAVHSWQAWSDAANRNFQIDNGTVGQDTTNAGLASDMTAWAFGNTPGATRYAMTNIALLLICTAYPGATQASAVSALAAAEFPP